MLSDARELASDQQVEMDVCIVGAGPAGISIARELIGNGARGLAAGERRQGPGTPRAAAEPRPERRLPDPSAAPVAGAGVRRDEQALVPARRRELGRSAARPDRLRGASGIRYSGWPFDRAHLEPYYIQAQEVCRLGPFDYDPGSLGRSGADAAPAALSGAVETTMFQHGTDDFEGYYEELVRAPNVTLLLHATVVELATEGDPDRVDRVEVRREDGSRCFVRARLVVLAAGGIENPRLLLLSRRVHRNGLGNDHDLVGRFFAERMSARTGYIVASIPELISRAGFYGSTRPRPGCGFKGRCGSATPCSGSGSSSTARSSCCPETAHDGRGRQVGRHPGQGSAPPPAASGNGRAPAQRRHRPRGSRRVRS